MGVIDASLHQVGDDVAAVHPAGHVVAQALAQKRARLGAGILVGHGDLQRIADEDFHAGHRFTQDFHRAANPLADAREGRHVVVQPASIRRPQADVAAEKRGDERFVDRADARHAARVAFAEGPGEPLQRRREIRVREGVRQPRRRAEVREVEHQVDAEFLEQRQPRVEPRPVVLTRLALDLVPGQGVAQPLAAEVAADEFIVLPPEAVVLGPFVLVDAQVGDERALDTRGPAKVGINHGGNAEKRYSRRRKAR